MSKIKKQVPPNFRILPLPQEIESFIYSLLHSLPERTQQAEQHKISSLCLGKDGDHSSKTLASAEHLSSSHFQDDREQSSYLPSHKPSEKETFLQEARTHWSVKQSDQPWTTFVRPSETTTMKTHDSIQTKRLADFYNNSTRAIKKRIQERNKRNLSP